MMMAVTGIRRGLQFGRLGAGRPFYRLGNRVARGFGEQASRGPGRRDFQQFAATPRRCRHDVLPSIRPEPYHFHRPAVALAACCISVNRLLIAIISITTFVRLTSQTPHAWALQPEG